MQLPLNLIEPPRPCLADGVTGQNAAALDALRAIITDARGGFSSIYLWGAPGCGKSFWLQAWAADHPHQAHYIDCDTASSGAADPIQAIEAAIDSLQPNGHSACWLLDHVDAASQETISGLFQLYNAARESGGKIVAAASVAPIHLAMRDDLRTRFGQSLIFELHELSDIEKENALRERAQRLGLTLPEEVLRYLLTRLPRNLGRLTQIIDALNELALSRQRLATIPLLKELLDSLDASTRPV